MGTVLAPAPARRAEPHPVRRAEARPRVLALDVLQRVSEHPASRVIELTPRLWKTRFADNPLRSDLEHDPPAH